MGNVCDGTDTDKEREIMAQMKSSEARSKDRGSTKDVTELKYYGEMKQQQSKRIEVIQRRIDEKEKEIQQLESKLEELEGKEDKRSSFELQRITRKIDAHRKIIEQNKLDIKKIENR